MVLELVKEKDCIARNGKGKVDEKSNRHRFKKITARDRRRCYICGHNDGQWFEYFKKGRQEYHFLCRNCIDTIESGYKKLLKTE